MYALPRQVGQLEPLQEGMSWHPRKQRRLISEQNCTMFSLCPRYTAQGPPLTGASRQQVWTYGIICLWLEPGRRFSDVDDRKHGERARSGEILTLQPAAVVIHAEMMALKPISVGL